MSRMRVVGAVVALAVASVVTGGCGMNDDTGVIKRTTTTTGVPVTTP